MVSAGPHWLEVLGLIPTMGEIFSLSKYETVASLAGLILIQCAVLWILMLPGGPKSRESVIYPLHSLKVLLQRKKNSLVIHPAKLAPCG